MDIRTKYRLAGFHKPKIVIESYGECRHGRMPPPREVLPMETLASVNHVKEKVRGTRLEILFSDVMTHETSE